MPESDCIAGWDLQTEKVQALEERETLNEFSPGSFLPNAQTHLAAVPELDLAVAPDPK
jgi:hypothetical protein